MSEPVFGVVCETCLHTQGIEEGAAPAEECPVCGGEPAGPFAVPERFTSAEAAEVASSRLYAVTFSPLYEVP